HSAQPGTGYKQLGRHWMTDTHGVQSERIAPWLHRFVVGSPHDAHRPQANRHAARSFGALLDVERGASFMYPGGLVAARAAGRQRGAIWDALKRREVYGTSGPRILLWFDLLNAPDGGRAPMGRDVTLAEAPRFEVRAVGAFKQLPGCPEESRAGLS